MTIPDVLLRVGVSFVAWMVLYTHCIWLATLRVIGCESGDDELWRLLLGFAPVTIGFCFLLTAINPLREVAKIIRWLALPFIVVIPLAVMPVISAMQTASIGSAPICGTAAVWHAWWAPVQVVTLGVISFMVFRVWRLAGY